MHRDHRSTGDALAFVERLPKRSVHLLATDPPWSIPGGGLFLKAAPYALQEMSAIQAVFEAAARACKPGAHAYIFAPSAEIFDDALDAVRAAGWRLMRLLVWDKAPWGGGGLAGGAWRNSFEPILVLSNGAPRAYQRGKQWTATLRQRATYTRTSKPPELYRCFLEASTAPGELAIDPWCGLDPLARAASMPPARHWLSNDILTPAQVEAQATDRRTLGRRVTTGPMRVRPYEKRPR